MYLGPILIFKKVLVVIIGENFEGFGHKLFLA